MNLLTFPQSTLADALAALDPDGLDAAPGCGGRADGACVVTPPGALGLTAVVLLICAVVGAAIASEGLTRRRRDRARVMAWVTFAASGAAFIGAAWWEALS